MDPISIALGIAQFAAPRIGKWLFGEDGEAVANEVIEMGKAATGESQPENVLAALKADPAAVIEFQRMSQALEVRYLEENTRRLEAINTQMGREAESCDRYVSRWRPTIGYVVAFQLGMLGIAIFMIVVGAMIAAFQGRPEIVEVLFAGLASLVASLTAILTVELGVLGVNIAQRSRDKQVAAGQMPDPGLLGALAKRIAGRG